ncbi:hypothetical protein [Bradyrhizobium prioriisuperbiae]|uniref:hypothetical protein n=1 Tax=Bradyrhizobium prioriisuperbiae TaxID=2854389 RepID=UPI0028E4AEBC|nr:hypothetical protein [Bradyrhizobium prioritasuperba]
MSGRRLPPTGWLPVAASWRDDTLRVDWSFFGEQPLREPFFDDSVQHALRKPFNRLFRYQTPIERLPEWLQANRHLQPDGFIFHMSRCGSTLVSQMLGALPGAIAISEAGPVDTVVNARRINPDLSEDDQVRWLQWMISAFGQARRGDERLFVVKLDCWHTRDLALFRRAFPTVPWIFLYRDPVEVLVSHRRQPGMQMLPQLVGADRFGLNPDLSWQAPAEYQARVLAGICEPMVRHDTPDGGLLINHRQLPQAVSTLIMPHFGIATDAHEQTVLTEAGSRNAKMPGDAFVNDSAGKQHDATATVRDLADRWLTELYRQLEAKRLGQPTAHAVSLG